MNANRSMNNENIYITQEKCIDLYVHSSTFEEFLVNVDLAALDARKRDIIACRICWLKKCYPRATKMFWPSVFYGAVIAAIFMVTFPSTCMVAVYLITASISIFAFTLATLLNVLLFFDTIVKIEVKEKIARQR